MDEKQLRDRIIQNIIILMNSDNTPSSSMRNMSNSIGASGNYMQTLLSGATSPSLNKIAAIADYFDVDPSELFKQTQNCGSSKMSLHKLIDSCPEEMCPVIEDIVTVLLKHNNKR